MSTQLLEQSFPVLQYSNSVFRNISFFKGDYILLRENGLNQELLRFFSSFKPLILDLARKVDAESITDVALVKCKPMSEGSIVNLGKAENRLILALESECAFIFKDKRVVVPSGWLLWTDDEILIENTSTNTGLFLVIETKEFKI